MNYVLLYPGCVYGAEREKPFREAWAKTGKKLDMGKSCVRFKKLDDVPLKVIGQAVKRYPVKKFIGIYEAAIKDSPRKSRAGLKKKVTKKK